MGMFRFKNHANTILMWVPRETVWSGSVGEGLYQHGCITKRAQSQYDNIMLSEQLCLTLHAYISTVVQISYEHEICICTYIYIYIRSW